MNASTAKDLACSLVITQFADKFSGRVLDAGCGAKPYKRLFAFDGEYREPVTEWVGLDVRPVGDVTGDVQKMPFEDSSFDTILCTDTLQYVQHPFVAFKEFARVLKPGGTLMVVAPNVEADEGEAFWGFKLRSLGMLAESVGLVIDSLDAASRLWQYEFDNARGMVAYELLVPTEMRGWVGSLDERYPSLSVLVASKE